MLMDNMVLRYQLCSKDVPLVDFSYSITAEFIEGVTSISYDIKIDRIYYSNIGLLPKNLNGVNENSLFEWIKNRKVPKNRLFVDKIIGAIQENGNPFKYVDVTFALSVNDAYWINNRDFPRKWKDVNLYAHPFDDILSYVAFTGHSRKVSGVKTSPELTTNGMQRKSWTNRNDNIYLMKAATDFLDRGNRSDVYSEFYAAQVAEAMGFDHVPYDLEFFTHKDGQKELVSLCPAFTSENVGFIPVYHLLDFSINTLSDYSTELKIGEVFGKEAFEDMMLFDSIIINTDRHLSNFGLLFNTNNNEIIGPAPLFDHGMSLMAGAANGDFKDMDNYISVTNNPFDISFDEMMYRFVQKRHLPKLRHLKGFKFVPYNNLSADNDYLKKITVLIQNQAEKAISMYEKKKKLISDRAKKNEKIHLTTNNSR